jgi:hypothetical protein
MLIGGSCCGINQRRETDMIENERLDEFINMLIDAKSPSGLTATNRRYLVDDLREHITQQVYRAVLDALSDESFDAFEAEASSSNPNAEKLQQIITDSGIDVGKITAETLVKFRSFYLGGKKA